MINKYHFIKSLVRHPVLFFKTLRESPKTNSDVTRWRQSENLKEDWDGRTVKIASLIPEGADVLEFGAGRFVLRDHLPPGCTYQPSDIVDRGEGTLVCDLNKGFPSLQRRYTHTVFSGVLEYVADIGEVVESLKKHTDVIIASYATTDMLSDYITRRRNGWLNHLSDTQFVAVFAGRGFILTQKCPWQLQTIYVFENVK